MLEFKVYNREARTELGTLASLAGKGGNVRETPNSAQGKTESVALIVTRADGTSAVLPCSLPLTGMLRSKEVTLAQCLAFPVIEFTHRDTGAVINMLVQPTREYGEAAVLKVDDVKVIPEFKPEAVNFESLIALGV